MPPRYANGRDATERAAQERRILVDPPTWAGHRGTTSFRFAHRLTSEPLLSIERLAELADRLPDAAVESTAATQQPVDAHGRPGRVEAGTAGDLLRHIAERDAWMSLLRIEQDAEYRALLAGLLEEFAAGAGAADAHGVEGYVFVSAAGATTPAHVDHEHNLYVQLRGTKRFTIGGFPSPDARHRVLEGLYAGGYGATGFLPSDPVTHVLEPGDGVYVPPSGVHLVENGPATAVSLSIVFHTPDLDREAKVYACNADLRRIGLRPRPPGERIVVDGLKSAAVTWWRRLRALGRPS
jgi:quercetin dioxygenase-like cupin family protein